MDEISISKFKATCLAVLEKVRATGEPIRVTRFGRPIAEIVPHSAATAGLSEPRQLGLLEGQLGIFDDASLADVHVWHEDETMAGWDRLMTREPAPRKNSPTGKRVKA